MMSNDPSWPQTLLLPKGHPSVGGIRKKSKHAEEFCLLYWLANGMKSHKFLFLLILLAAISKQK